jgi:hypothetical protein
VLAVQPASLHHALTMSFNVAVTPLRYVDAMKAMAQKITNPLKGLLGKGKTAPKVRSVVKKNSGLAADKVNSCNNTQAQPFCGPPDLVAANQLWGPGRLWPRDEASEASIPWQAGEGARIGILGAGLGGYGKTIATRVPTASVSEFEWRSDIARWRTEIGSDQDSASSFYELNTNVLLPPPVRSTCILAVEPIIAQAGDALVKWARLALESGGTLILEELTTDSPSKPSRESSNSWLARTSQNGQWLRLDEQESLLRKTGFIIGKVRERTGAHLRALRMALDLADERIEPLNAAINHAPELQKVADHFNCERNAAKSRLKALEHGALAVYRIEVIKPRAEELI